MKLKAKKRSKARTFWKWTKRILLFMFISSTLYLILCKWLMPPITITQLTNSFSYGLKREYVQWEQISPNVKLAAIASEDQMFLEHSGIDWAAIEKSFEEPKSKKKKRKRIKGGGASTISQQTAKNVFLWQGSGIVSRYIRKAPEFYFTKLIEWTWSKNRILEVYLNTIEMGPGIFGIEAAAKVYYKKSARDLTKAEAAAIIACLPNPQKYTVVPQSRWVRWKSSFILRQMNNIQDDADIQGLIK